MAQYRGFQIPDDLQYDLDFHVWLKVEGEHVLVGATDPAQAYAGEIIHMSIKKPGTQLKRRDILATVESAKYMGPMRSPVHGTVVEINEQVKKKPSLVNRGPYANWVAKLKPDDLAADLGALISGPEAAEQYQPVIDEWGIEAAGAS